MCHNASSPAAGTGGAVGSSCNLGRECLYGLCSSNVCTAPELRCPTSASGTSVITATATAPVDKSAKSMSFLMPFLRTHGLYYHIYTGLVCSGRGICTYSDPSGNTLQSCSILDVRCAVSCSCTEGFAGKDCSLSLSVLTERTNLRY